jgi:hypothetical protein
MALGPNLIRNGYFYLGDHFPTGWAWTVQPGSHATVTLSDSVTHFGHRTMRIRNANGAPDVYGSLSMQVNGIHPGKDYLVRLWAKGDDVNDCWFGGGPNWVVRESFPQGSYGWQLLELRLSAPPDAGPTFDLRVNVEGPTESLWVADVTFQELRPAPQGGPYSNYTAPQEQPGVTYYPPNVVVGPPPPAYYYPYSPYLWYDPGFTVVVPVHPHGWGFGWGWGGGGRHWR